MRALGVVKCQLALVWRQKPQDPMPRVSFSHNIYYVKRTDDCPSATSWEVVRYFNILWISNASANAKMTFMETHRIDRSSLIHC